MNLPGVYKAFTKSDEWLRGCIHSINSDLFGARVSKYAPFLFLLIAKVQL